MKIKSFLVLAVVAIICVFNIGNTSTFAEARSIYIGDEIVLEINDSTITEEEIRDAFDGFRLIGMENTDEGYRVTISPKEVGQEEVLLKNQKIIIDVKSTLDEIQRDTIFEKDLETGNSFDRRLLYILLSISGLVFIVSHGIWLIKIYKKDEQRQYTPYEVFIKMYEEDQIRDKNILGELTKASKLYLSKRLETSLIGLTTSQLSRVHELNAIDERTIQKYFEWLRECDDMKYKGDFLAEEEILEMRQKLKVIVDDLENLFLQEDRRVMENAV